MKSNDNSYYAVKPTLVVLAAKLFDIRSSILEGGARSLYNRALALQSGKADGQWGRHQRSVIERFCEFTITSVSGPVLPWQELVEDEMKYDGREGVSSRTGNRPLATVKRFEVKRHALVAILKSQSISVAVLAERTGLPPIFLQAIVSGEWADVSISTAEVVAHSLEVAVDELFEVSDCEPRQALVDELADGDCREPVKPQLTRFSLTLQKMRIVWAALAITFVACSMWFFDAIEYTSIFSKNSIENSKWRMSVELKNKNIPVPEDTIQLWQNGGYLILKQNGVIAFNWINVNDLVDLPSDTTFWILQDGLLTLHLGEVHYRFEDAVLNDSKLIAFDTTKTFVMTLLRIH